MQSNFRIMKRISLIVICLGGIMMKCYSQETNLINDSGFEKINSCVNDVSQLDHSVYWYSPIKCTPDLFTTCFDKENRKFKINPCGVPQNATGYRFPHSGENYAGLILYCVKYPWNSEYIATKLKSPLEPNKKYCLKYFISLANSSTYGVSEIGTLFYSKQDVTSKFIEISMGNDEVKQISEKKIKTYQTSRIKATPQIINNIEFLTDTMNWVCLKSIYTAQGGEEFLTIGSFSLNSNLKTFKGKKIPRLYSKTIGNSGGTAYYYIDDVTLVPIQNESECTCGQDAPIKVIANKDSIDKPEVGKAVVLNNIYFETDKSELLASSNEELDKLFKMLMDNPKIVIEISGHTDNTGTKDHNKLLSEARAKAVVDYLIKKGIQKDKLTYKGYGADKPIATNDTEEGRAKNRRVEFKIISE
jgi:OOP family OmpA-OmpF porin